MGRLTRVLDISFGVKCWSENVRKEMMNSEFTGTYRITVIKGGLKKFQVGGRLGLKAIL